MKLHAAIFYTKDLDRSVTFYESTIGLTKAFQEGDVYAAFMLENDSQLHIKRAEDERDLPGGQTAIIECEDTEQRYEDLKSKGVTIYSPLEKASWGTTFSLLDPDGNKLEFVTE